MPTDPSPATQDALSTALALHQAGDWQDAEQRYLDILRAEPDHPKVNHNLGVLAVQRGQPEQGLPYFQTALNADPAHGQYWLSYIDALLQAGQTDNAYEVLAFARQQGLEGEDVDALDERLKSGDTQREPGQPEIDRVVAAFNTRQLAEAETLARAMTQRFPRHAFGWKALGTVLLQRGRSAEALGPMRQAAALVPDDAQAHSNLGIILKQQGRLDEAGASYREALRLQPDYADAHYNLGNVLREQGRPDEAARGYRHALRIKPDFAEAHNNLGNVLREQGRPGEAETVFRHALKIRPDYAEAHSNLGIALHDQERLDEAATSLLRALDLAPNYVEAHGNLGLVLKDQGRLDEAEARIRHALALEPGNAETRHNLGQTLLMAGKLAQGWPEYEHRWDGSSPKRPRPETPLPQWTGQTPRDDDRLLVFKEQGFGDQIQFCRYLSLAAERFAGGVSVVAPPSLATLLRRSFPDVEILDSAPADQSAWQWQCPLLSLPLAFGATLDNLPAHVPYLAPDPVRVSRWESRIGTLNLPRGTRRIGLVWKPGQRMKNAPHRTLALQQLARLLELPGCAWFSLQKEPDPDKAPWVASGKLIDWSAEFGDFDDTAALAAHLDLVISVDTAAAHLAGALGRPVWLLNRRAGEWRWLHNREDSPWYPTMRIFTQASAGDWDEVVQRVRVALEKL